MRNCLFAFFVLLAAPSFAQQGVPEISFDSVPDFLKLTLDGKVLGVIGRSGRRLKYFSGAHELACPSENEIDTAETSNWRVQKLILHPQTK